jgi:hypothetical protein
MISVNSALDKEKYSGKEKCLSLKNMTSNNDVATLSSESDKFS